MRQEYDRLNKAESLLKAGRAFEAYSHLMKNPPLEESLAYNRLLALSLIRLGATARAKSIIEPYYKNGDCDCETAGIIGRVYKDLWKKSGDTADAKKSRDIYYKAFRKSGDYYPGINAATMSLMLGEEKRAKGIARAVYSSLEPAADYWVLVTLGEACLILEKIDKAVFFYRDALRIAAGDYGNIASSNQQLVLIASYRSIPAEVTLLFKGPVVMIFSGNMIDTPGRRKPRFTENIVSYVREEIRNEIVKNEVQIGYSSAACGTDLIFIEEMKRAKGEVNILLPFNIEDFIRTSVGFAGEGWVKRFKKALQGANVHYITEENYLGCDDLFSFTNQILVGTSSLRAKQFLSKPMLLTVIDSEDTTSAKGGARDLVAGWKDKKNLRIIDLKKYAALRSAAEVKPPADSVPTEKAAMPFGIRRLIKCILFSDIVHYTRIADQYTPYFMHELLEAIGEKYKNLRVQPEAINTWGDAIFAVYENAQDMMEFATVVRNTITGTDWSEKNLPRNLNVRISLHAGPIFMGMDSITNRLNAYGSHINRTARMEAVTVPGCIYASMQFASRLIYETGSEYKYEYVGIIELPKKFGRQEMFHIYK